MSHPKMPWERQGLSHLALHPQPSPVADRWQEPARHYWTACLFYSVGVGLLLLVAYIIFSPRPRTDPPGALVQHEPVQTTLRSVEPISINGWTFTVKADYQIEAMVLGAERYRLGADADIVPVDLALGWEEMSDPTVIKKVSITQSGRWYMWRARSDVGVSPRKIAQTSANTHIAPLTEDVKKTLFRVRAGDVVKISGYLVRIKDPQGRTIFDSSMTRNDTGDGACEVVLARSIEIENR